MTKNSKEPGLIKPRFSSASIYKKGGEKPLPEAGKEKDGIRRLRPGAIPQSLLETALTL